MSISKNWESISPVRRTYILLYSIEYSKKILEDFPYFYYLLERSFCYLKMLYKEDTRVVLITPTPVELNIIDYYLKDLYQMNDEQERSAYERLVLLSPKSESLLSLTDLVIEDAAIITSLEEEKSKADDVELINFLASKKIELLGQQLNAAVEELPESLCQYWGSKSGSKQAFFQSGVQTPRGTSDIFKSIDDIKNAALQLAKSDSPAQRIIVKLNGGNWGNGLGNAVINCEKLLQTNDLFQSVERICQSWESFVNETAKGGAIIEEYLSGATCSPSGQGYIDNCGKVKVLSSHEQILVEDKYVGCVFPAPTQYLSQIYSTMEKVGKILSNNGVRGTFGIDFIAFDNGELLAVEINIRKLAISHIFSSVSFVMNDNIGSDGLLRNKNGEPIFYVHRRLYEPSLLKSLDPKTAVETLKRKGLFYDSKTQTGTVLHMLSALKPCGYVEITSIGNSREEVFGLDERVQEALLNKANTNLM